MSNAGLVLIKSTNHPLPAAARMAQDLFGSKCIEYLYLLVGTGLPPLIMHFMAMMCVACDYINGSMDEIGLGFQLMSHSISHACHLQRISTMR